MRMITNFIMITLLLSATLFTCLDAKAQDTILPNRDIALKIVNKRGRPISKIIVHSLKSGNGGMTDHTGLFIFKDIADNDTISANLPNDIYALIPVAGMDSIVIKTYRVGTYSYQDNSGQIQFIKRSNTDHPSAILDVPAILQNNPFTTLTQLLQGRVAGLSIHDGKANIRGINSFTSPSTPLIVLDGSPIGALEEAENMVDIYNISTIEILKDGSGWGLRGANGVILIKTK